MLSSSSKLFVFSVLLLLLLFVPVLLVNASSEGDAVLVLDDADEGLGLAFEAVLEAEQAGANVSILLDQMDLAGEYLAEAHVWYRLGAFDNACKFAGLCLDAVEGVASTASRLRDEAKSSGETNFVLNTVGSAVGVVVVVVSGYFGWIVFKRHYLRRVGLRSKVISGES